MHNSDKFSKNTVIQLFRYLLVLFALATGLSCSNDNPVDSGNDFSLFDLAVTPNSGPPLTSVVIKGLDPQKIDLSRAYALLNGRLTPLFTVDNTVRLTVPVFVDTITSWSDSTVTTLSLQLIDAETEEVIGSGDDVFTMTPLVPAPGSVAQMVGDWQSISTSLQTISEALGSAPGVEQQVLSSLLFALDGVINSDDPVSLVSLTTRLAAEEPEAQALLDALYGASGVVEQSQEYAGLFATMAESAVALQKIEMSKATTDATVLTDQQLAFRMQFYVVVREFGRTVIKPTAQTYAIVTGAIGLVGNIPIASVINATLSIIDFVVNKFVVSTMPAKIDSLRIDLPEGDLFVGEKTDAMVMIYAANDPQSISFQDVVAQILNVVGLGASLSGPAAVNQLDDLKDVLINVTNYMLGLYQTGLSNYAEANPDLNLDINLVTLPDLQWQARIVDTKFVDLKTHTPNLIQPIAGEVNWQVDASNTGEGRIYAITTTGSDATVIPQPPGFAYSGGAFGEDVAAAPARSVLTIKKVAMEVDFATAITASGSNILGVKGGHFDSDGNPVFEAGLLVDLFTIGGTATPSTGLTNNLGQFSSVIALDALSDSVQVQITVTDSDGSAAQDTVTARIQGNNRIAFFSLRDGGPGLWTMNPDDINDVEKLITVQPPETSSYPGYNLSWSRDSRWLVFSMQSGNGPGIYTTTGDVGSYQRTIMDPRFVRTDGPNAQSWLPTPANELLVGAQNKNSPTNKGLYLGNASTGSKSFIAGSYRSPVRVSPDGELLATLYSCGDGTRCVGVFTLANPTFASIVTVANPTGVYNIRYLMWTEDGAALIYALDFSGTSYEIRKVDPNGANDSLLSSGSGSISAMTVLPTKNAIAIAAGSDPDYAISIVSLSGGTVIDVPGAFHRIFALSPSPDGEFLAFDNRTTVNNVYKVNLTTFEETQLTFDDVSYNPAWSGTMR